MRKNSNIKIVVIVIMIMLMGMCTGCGEAETESATTQSVEEVVKNDDKVNDVVEDKAEIEEVEVSEVEKAGNNIATMYDSFEVTSANLHDGKWDDVISNLEKGSNHSPQLSWEKIEGAELYVIYMVDVNVQYFMHWKADGITTTELPEGWAENDYVGPWPPTGATHDYDIYVFALKKPIDRLKGTLNGSNGKFPSFIEAIDTDVDGNTGNVISCGYLSGSFTN